MPGDVVAHGYLTLTEDMPFGNLPIQFRLPDGSLYEVEAMHGPICSLEKDGKAAIVEGKRMLEVKVRRLEQ